MARANIDYGLQDKKYPFYMGDVIFYFSSSLNRYKFSNRFSMGLQEMEERLKKRYYGKLDCYWPFALYQYVEIEHRGFRVEVRGETVRALEALHISCELVVDDDGELEQIPGNSEVGKAVQREDSPRSEESREYLTSEDEHERSQEKR